MKTDNASAGLAPANGSVLGTLPENWVCKECGKPAWQYASVVPVSEVDCSDRATIAEYGPGADMFTDGVEIEGCGYCGGARWRAPNTQGEPGC